MDEPQTLTERSFSRKLNQATYSPVVSLGLLVLALVALAGYLLHTMRWVDHTNGVIEKALYSQKLLLDLQTATRGYYLTGDVAMLSKYREAQDDLPATLRQLRELVGDSPGQSARVDKLMGDVHDWQTWAGETLKSAQARSDTRPAAGAVVRDEHKFDHISDDIATFLGNEYTMRDARSRRASRTAWWSLGIATGLTVVVAIVQCRGVRRRMIAIAGTYRTALRLAKERRVRVEELLRELDGELKAVGEIQRSLLPIELPTIEGLEIAASYQTSQRAGGDYYDFFVLPPSNALDHRSRLGVLIADVSGHGTPAAVLMAVTHSIAHGFEQPDRPPAELLEFVNRRLCQGYTMNNTAFVTAFYAIYDPATRKLTYSSAGHNPPRLRVAGSKHFEALDDAQSLPLGVMEDEQFVSSSRTLRPGDTLVLYTDGITEARDADGRFLNVDGLDAAIEHAEDKAQAMMLAGLEAVRKLAGDAVVDDRTLMVVRATGRDATDEPPRQALVVETLPADPVAIARGQ